MALKSKVQRILPPLLFDALDKRLQKKEIYKNYSDAIKHCSTPDGYETDDIVRVVFEKTLRHKGDIEAKSSVHLGNLEAFALTCFVHLMDRKRINVIDFGGGCGSHFFTFRHFLPKNITLNWFVVETPAMVRYAKQFENEHLKFYDDLDLALNNAKKNRRN